MNMIDQRKSCCTLALMMLPVPTSCGYSLVPSTMSHANAQSQHAYKFHHLCYQHRGALLLHPLFRLVSSTNIRAPRWLPRYPGWDFRTSIFTIRTATKLYSVTVLVMSSHTLVFYIE
ncbi:hypothetical protein F5Y01DRAFT_59330 [Xylaria sp. FL0043]|nr:hypothetical protein F5Y01DRAFT_59330 [Xylaria sp. FL0043]